MARKRTALDRMRAQIADLPRLPELVFEGGPRQLGVTMRDGVQLVQPHASLWVESPSGLVRAFELIDHHADLQRQTDQALEALCTACALPMGKVEAPSTHAGTGIVDLAAVREQRQAPRAPQMRPGLPGRILVVDRALAEAVRALVEPLGIPVAFAEHAPAFEAAAEALGEFVDQMVPDAENAPFAWNADVALVRALCKATASFRRRAPWEYMPDTPPVRIELGTHGPEPGVTALYASILGGGGMVSGVAFYYSLEDVLQAMESGEEMEPPAEEDIDTMITMLKQSGVPVDQIPRDVLQDMVGSVLEEQGLSGTAVEEVAQNSLAVLFASSEETGPDYIAWFKDRDIKLPAREGLPLFVRTEVGQKTRQPNDREVIALTLGVEGLNQFFTRHKHALEGPLLPPEPHTLSTQVSAGATTAAIAVTFPPLEWEEALEASDDEDDEDDDDDE